MRRIAQVILASTAVLGFSGAASADDWTGNYLLSLCEGPHPFQAGVCVGFIAGVLQSNDLMRGEFRTCVPRGVSPKQAVDVLIKFLRQNPQQRHLPSLAVVQLAMLQEFPCAK